jgi:hypothetical protein
LQSSLARAVQGDEALLLALAQIADHWFEHEVAVVEHGRGDLGKTL